MKVAYIQPIGGVSGDMLLASLMHLGLNISKLNDDLNKLDLGAIKISSTQNVASGFSGLLAKVEYENKNWRAQNFQDFISIVKKSVLDDIMQEYCLKRNQFDPKKPSPNRFVNKLQLRMKVYYKIKRKI